MSGLLPAAVYGLQVPCGDLMVPAAADFPASVRITMAAIDPTAAPEFAGPLGGDAPIRATLKLIRQPPGSEADEDSEDGGDPLDAILNGTSSDEDEEDESSDDDEKNGGPSDPAKSKRARREAAMQQLKEALAEEESDEDDDMGMNGGKKPNGVIAKPNKGKEKVSNIDAMDEDDSEDEDYEEFVLCTLDPEKHYQQPLDITIAEDEVVYFKVSGTHAIYLTGNYVIPVDDRHQHGESDSDEGDDDYGLSTDLDEVYDDEESDELDDVEDPRITEVGSEDEAEVPKLVKAEQESMKGKNKRVAEDSDEPANLDDIMAKSLKPEAPAINGEQKLSKKQLKKLKNNAGKAVDATAAATNGVKSTTKGDAKNEAKSDAKAESAEAKDKKVKFAKHLEQGPSGTSVPSTLESEKKADTKKDDIKKDAEKPKSSLGVKMIQGVKIDDKKLGSGPAAKKGDKVAMRYIGKLDDGKIFDANKKGTPFGFKLGSGEVIKGWDIGIAGMCIGGERRITIPAHLAYGKKSMPGIPANSTLTFEVKLLEIK